MLSNSPSIVGSITHTVYSKVCISKTFFVHMSCCFTCNFLEFVCSRKANLYAIIDNKDFVFSILCSVFCIQYSNGFSVRRRNSPMFTKSSDGCPAWGSDGSRTAVSRPAAIQAGHTHAPWNIYLVSRPPSRTRTSRLTELFLPCLLRLLRNKTQPDTHSRKGP